MNASLRTFLLQLKKEGLRKDVPNISFEVGEILQFFVRIIQAKNILEIGCANGFSTIFLAEAVIKNEGRVVACDVSFPSFREAQKNISQAGFDDTVEFRFGDGVGICRDHETFDLIFIDAQKNKTHLFFEYSKNFLSSSGIICIDNTKKFPQKMKLFTQMRSREKEFLFFDIEKKNQDSLAICLPISISCA